MASAPAGRYVVSDAIPSRESQEERHCETARQARSGRPRWKVEAMRPKEIAPKERAKAASANQRLSGRSGVPVRRPIRNSRP
jgi:hypothetical protein